MSKADRELSGNFANNRGKLPMPITGAQRLAWKVAGLYQADVSLFHMPVYAAGEEDREVFMRQPVIRDLTVDIFIVLETRLARDVLVLESHAAALRHLLSANAEAD